MCLHYSSDSILDANLFIFTRASGNPADGADGPITLSQPSINLPVEATD